MTPRFSPVSRVASPNTDPHVAAADGTSRHGAVPVDSEHADRVDRARRSIRGCPVERADRAGTREGPGAEANRVLTRAYVEQGNAHAALVMNGDGAIAWAEYGAKVELPTAASW